MYVCNVCMLGNMSMYVYTEHVNIIISRNGGSRWNVVHISKTLLWHFMQYSQHLEWCLSYICKASYSNTIQLFLSREIPYYHSNMIILMMWVDNGGMVSCCWHLDFTWTLHHFSSLLSHLWCPCLFSMYKQ